MAKHVSLVAVDCAPLGCASTISREVPYTRLSGDACLRQKVVLIPMG